MELLLYIAVFFVPNTALMWFFSNSVDHVPHLDYRNATQSKHSSIAKSFVCFFWKLEIQIKCW